MGAAEASLQPAMESEGGEGEGSDDGMAVEGSSGRVVPAPGDAGGSGGSAAEGAAEEGEVPPENEGEALHESRGEVEPALSPELEAELERRRTRAKVGGGSGREEGVAGKWRVPAGHRLCCWQRTILPSYHHSELGRWNLGELNACNHQGLAAGQGGASGAGARAGSHESPPRAVAPGPACSQLGETMRHMRSHCCAAPAAPAARRTCSSGSCWKSWSERCGEILRWRRGFRSCRRCWKNAAAAAESLTKPAVQRTRRPAALESNAAGFGPYKY